MALSRAPEEVTVASKNVAAPDLARNNKGWLPLLEESQGLLWEETDSLTGQGERWAPPQSDSLASSKPRNSRPTKSGFLLPLLLL